MKTAELRTLSVEDLKQKLEDLADELANLRIQKATHQLTNPNRIGEVRKDIARHKTLLSEYEKGISQPKSES